MVSYVPAIDHPSEKREKIRFTKMVNFWKRVQSHFSDRWTTTSITLNFFHQTII